MKKESLTHSGSRRVRILAAALPAAFILIGWTSAYASPKPQAAPEGRKFAQAARIQLVPPSGFQGQTLRVTAQGLAYSRRLELSFVPEGLTVSNVQGTPASSPRNTLAAVPSTPASPVSFTLTIAKHARPGPYTLVIGTPDGAYRVPKAFTVLARRQPVPQFAPPRVDRVSPQDLQPGKTYTLNLTGEAFRQGMRVSFGPDLQNLGPPIVLDPHRAKLSVLVAPSAIPGVRLASASSPEGRPKKGPGGIQVVQSRTGLIPKETPVLDLKHLKPGVVKPHGHITLWAPNRKSGNAVAVYSPGDSPMVQRGTLFTWAEDNPGLAKYFVLYIKDKNGTVIAKAQTPASKPYYRVSAAFLKGLPPPDSLPYFNWSPPLPVVAKPVMKARAVIGKRYAPYVQPASMTSGEAGGSASPSVSTSVKPSELRNYINAHMDETAVTQLDLHGLGKAGNANATWEVKGYWTNPVTGEDEAVESSMVLPLRLPAAPTGLFDCDAAAKGGSVTLQSGGGGAVPVTGQPVLLSGTVDVSESPYRLTSPFYVLLPGMPHKENYPTTYDNVYLSWGDGEVDRLTVDRPKPDDATIAIRRDGKPLSHVYGRAGTFQVKIYVMPDEQDQDPSAAAVYGSNSIYGQALQALYAKPQTSGGAAPGGGTAAPTVTIGASSATPAGGGLATGHPGAGATVDANAPPAIKLPGEDAYLLACASVEIQEPLDQTAYGPLHLKQVNVVFPGQAKSPPEVTDCSDAFTATARISYYGMGKIALGWSVDGGDEIVQEPPEGIGPGKKSPLSQVEIHSPPLPTSLSGSPHSLTVRVWVVSDAEASSVSSSGSGDPPGASQAGTSSRSPIRCRHHDRNAPDAGLLFRPRRDGNFLGRRWADRTPVREDPHRSPS